MSDYIKREDAKQLFLNHMGNEFPQSIKEQIVEKAFEELPLSADVVEVVRCKDCKYYVPISEKIGECKDTRMNSTYMSYCSYGEEKEHGDSKAD